MRRPSSSGQASQGLDVAGDITTRSSDGSASTTPDGSPRGLSPQRPKTRRGSAETSTGSTRSRRSGNFKRASVSVIDTLIETAPPYTHARPRLQDYEDGKGALKAVGVGKLTPTTPRPEAPRAQRSAWAIGCMTLLLAVGGVILLFAIPRLSAMKVVDSKGCQMSYMRPSYKRFTDFDTEHTRFGAKYSLHLYREGGVDDHDELRGIPVLFIPGNAGSYKQVRPIAAEAANHFHDVLQHDQEALKSGVRGLDIFAVDFNEDFTAFHGQTLLDQAEYINEAVRYILSLYLDPRFARLGTNHPDPSSVIVLGHSMGGIVARTMLIMPNYQANSINTIITMSAPHARPPITFDSDIVKIYDDINSYWRQAYTQKWASDNPLRDVTLVSIAGGTLDTVVPSDYASLESLVPESHGFTVFTSTIPNVWTSMDHLAIMWCDQFRKALTKAIYDVVDIRRASQTLPRAERMRKFRKRFLTGLEQEREMIDQKSPSTLLALDQASFTELAAGQDLTLRNLGNHPSEHAYLLPVTSRNGSARLSLLTNRRLDQAGENESFEVLLCSHLKRDAGVEQHSIPFTLELTKSGVADTELICSNAAPDVAQLPASTRVAEFPFPKEGEVAATPFSYLQYNVADLASCEYVAVVDKIGSRPDNFLVASFARQDEYLQIYDESLTQLLTSGLQVKLKAQRPLVTEIHVPSIRSSLLVYELKMDRPGCTTQDEMFAPLLRQYLNEPYESRFTVNLHQANISLYGISPFMPPALQATELQRGLNLQLWMDPACATDVELNIKVNWLSSFGKLYMQFRTALAAFPLLIVAIVIRKQFTTYDQEGIFVTFNEGLDTCLKRSLPLIIASLTLLSLGVDEHGTRATPDFWNWHRAAEPSIHFRQNDLLSGSHDPFFWFMIPLIALVCLGMCTAGNYVVLALTQILSATYSLIRRILPGHRQEDPKRNNNPPSAAQSPKQRLIIMAIFLLLVATCIPYQFAYLCCCLVQLFTTIRAHRAAIDIPLTANSNFYNYSHSILILLLWVLPINLPVVVVWFHNLAMQWLMPFSSHDNILAIMPYILLVETLSSGKMLPRVTTRLRHVTSLLLFAVGMYAAIYGVSYAFRIHYLVNWTAAWLVLLHSASPYWTTVPVLLPRASKAEMRKALMKTP